MVKVVNPAHTVCSLDYLVGTLATAYKGTITSLVAKDFCISDDGSETTLQGTILSMETGAYEASLNRNGVELSRVALKSGTFVFKAQSTRIQQTRDLQIDIVQAGRHIGTFLLKKENAGGLYMSAAELSEDLAGIDLTVLISPLRDKVGLLQKAEEIVSQLHSTKKDWAVFSEKMAGFARDFYWNSPEAFYQAFPVLVRFTLMAAERADSVGRSKAVSNFFDLLHLLFNNETELPRLRLLVETWLTSLCRSSVDIRTQAQSAVRSLEYVWKKYPDIELGGAVLHLIASLRNSASSPVFLDNRVLNPVVPLIPAQDADLLSRFGEPGRQLMMQSLHEAEQRVGLHESGSALDLIEGLDFDIFDDRKVVEIVFDVVDRGLSSESAGPLVEVAAAYMSTAPHMSDRAMDFISTSVPRILERLIVLGKAEVCADLLRKINGSSSLLRGRIMLSAPVARSILHSGKGELIAQYRDGLQGITIPAARVRGISTDTWAEIVNPLHLEQLTRFMELLEVGGAPLESILVHVTANLLVGGVLIPDDRLFQRRISAYLNSPAMKGNYLLNYLLLARFPVYFNDVGAVSRIRDYSTELDAWGNDAIIYFLRKQVHVNASSNNVLLVENIIRSWVMNDPQLLKNLVPADIAAKADQTLLERYSDVINPFFRESGVLDGKEFYVERVLQLSDRTIDDKLQDAKGKDAEAQRKVKLLCKLYKEIARKYSLVSRDTEFDDVHASLLQAADRLAVLRSTILSPEKTNPQESFYFKRHIAFGIPSVLGTYHERKFDALCDLMRYGEEIPVLLEMIIVEIEKKGPSATNSDLQKWLLSLEAAWQILKQYGLQDTQVDEFVAVLDRNRLHPPQIVDVLKMWQKELAWLVSSLTRIFHGPFREIISKFPKDDLPEHLIVLDPSSRDFTDKAADVVMRDLLNSIPGLVESDRLLAAVVTAMQSQRETRYIREQEMQESPHERDYYDIDAVQLQDALSLGPVLGTKAKNLIIAKAKGLPVPAGVVFPSRHGVTPSSDEGSRGFLPTLRDAVGVIEARTGRTFGNSDLPLFLSVRSGSYPSMPGILSSILYCGMNERTRDAFIRSTGKPDLGWDSYRRFIEHYGTAVLGLTMEFFDGIAKEYIGVRTLDASALRQEAHLKSLVSLYQERIVGKGLKIPEDAYEQLWHCIVAVYDSWKSDRARQFRSATGISEAWGTSVTLMEMVSGNQEGGGTSVFFTRDPVSGEQSAYGETRENASGIDLVSGRMAGRPLSRRAGVAGLFSLEEANPELYRLHLKLAREVENAFGGLPQEIEATYTRDRYGVYHLLLLQTRRMMEDRELARTFDEICGMESRVIGRGIGAHGGALSGVASFASSPDLIKRLAIKSGMPVILIRKTANTDDVSNMPVIEGIITATGGVTSHAAVLAHTFGLSAVVACTGLKIMADEQGLPFGIIGTTRIQEGSTLSIDGRSGLVFKGACFPEQNKT